MTDSGSPPATMPVALTIAGTDSSGGAGAFADLSTFAALGVWGTAAVTAVTAQNTLGVQAVETIAPAMVAAQIDSVATDLRVAAAKTGMLANVELVTAVADALATHAIPNLVVDPVFLSSHGEVLLDPAALAVLVGSLLPLAALVTPNLAELEMLTGMAVADVQQMQTAGRAVLDTGVAAVLVKGGHLKGDRSPDCLVLPGQEAVWLDGERIDAGNTHGTGCVLSAAVAARLAHGDGLETACRRAKEFVTRAIAGGLDLGRGVGPVRPTA